jgi:hypothetical protein
MVAGGQRWHWLIWGEGVGWEVAARVAAVLVEAGEVAGRKQEGWAAVGMAAWAGWVEGVQERVARPAARPEEAPGRQGARGREGRAGALEALQAYSSTPC